MSLIQEALRRQQEEVESASQGSGPPPEADAPVTTSPETTSSSSSAQPPPPPPPSSTPPAENATPTANPPSLLKKAAQEPPSEPTDTGDTAATPHKEKGALPTLIGILFVILLLVGGAVWIITFAIQQWKQGSGDTGAASAAAVVAETPAETSAPQPSSQPAATVSPPAPKKIAKPAAAPRPAPEQPLPRLRKCRPGSLLLRRNGVPTCLKRPTRPHRQQPGSSGRPWRFRASLVEGRMVRQS